MPLKDGDFHFLMKEEHKIAELYAVNPKLQSTANLAKYLVHEFD